jgi:uncharacterized membrane protein
MLIELITLAQQSTMPQFDGMYALMLVSRILHILAAIILVGGLFYLRFVISPADEPPLGASPVDQYFGGPRAAWAKWVGIATLLLLATGLFNYVQMIRTHEKLASSYHMVAGLKMIAGVVVFLLAALLAGRTAAAEALRQKWRLWLSVTLGIAVLTVALGSFLRTYPRTAKVNGSTPELIAPLKTSTE